MTDTRHPIYRRRRALVIGLVAYLADQNRPVPWDDLLTTFRDEKTSWKTLENVIRDLENFGALHRIGKAGNRTLEDTRALHATPLGVAWLEETLLPLPGQHPHDEDDEIPDDPFELADAIADHLEELDTLDLGNPLA